MNDTWHKFRKQDGRLDTFSGLPLDILCRITRDVHILDNSFYDRLVRYYDP